MKNLLIRTLFILFLFSGCDNGNTLESFYFFPDQNWKRFDNPIIKFEIDKPGIFYDMLIEVDYNASLTHKELPITVIMTTPSGEIRSRNLTLKMDDPEGKILPILRKDYAFSEKGVCTFEIENRSQYIESPGMVKIGIRLEKAE